MLPVDQFIPEIRETLKKHQSLVITAAPGAGKTTRVPPALLQVAQKKVVVLEPRRIAAAGAAARIAEENSWKLGEEVGYEVRFDKRTSNKTRLSFLTEALLLRKLASDRLLSEYDVVVLDEFHERSLSTDLAIGLLKELQMLERPDLKIVVMSATLDAARISEFLENCPVIDVPGRLFPISMNYDSKSQGLMWGPDLSNRVIDRLKTAVQKSNKDTLVFLPGQFEINQCMNLCSQVGFFDSFLKVPLHGRLSLDEQKLAIRPQSKRKIIFATNVAESSLTIDGLDCVVDTGLERVSTYQLSSGFQKLATRRISRASAAQRAGRSGRQFPGHCFRLWTQQDEQSFSDFALPEIKSQDLAETLLLLSSLGIQNWDQFSWFEKPLESQLSAADEKLKNLGLIEKSKITELGRRVQKNPLSLRESLLMENFRESSAEAVGAWVVALLSEKQTSLAPASSNDECDLMSRLQNPSLRNLDRVRKAAEQLSEQASRWTWSADLKPVVQLNLIRTFADHLGKKRGAETARGVLANGRGISIVPDSQVKSSPYFVVLQASDNDQSNETRVHWASGVSEEFLIKNFSEHIQQSKSVIWDEEKREFYEKTSRMLWGLEIGKPTLQRAEARFVEEQLPKVATAHLSWILKKSESFSRWWARYLFYIQKVQGQIVDSHFVQSAFEQACLGQRSLDDLLKINLEVFFEGALSPAERKNFQKLVPDSLPLGGDRRTRVYYEGENAPFVEVKIQHAFAWEKTPKVGNNELVTVVLLAPNMRPAQVTKDLEGFWSGSYSDVRKELKARYPKHDWPEPKTKK